MAHVRDIPGLPEVTTQACIHLRNKAMFVRGIENDPCAFPEETNTPQCWCNNTQHFVGPDGQYVGRHECIPGRDCYRETY